MRVRSVQSMIKISNVKKYLKYRDSNITFLPPFLNILKEADINFFFKVLAKFGDNKHDKDIKKNCEKLMFFFHRRGVGGKIWMENSITFNVFFVETFP